MISGWWVRRKEKAGGGAEEGEDDMEDVAPAPVRAFVEQEQPGLRPVQTASRPLYTEPTYAQDRPAPAAPVDPLTLDAKTRYKMLQSQGRYSSTARNNLWGSGSGSAYGRVNREDDNQL